MRAAWTTTSSRTTSTGWRAMACTRRRWARGKPCWRRRTRQLSIRRIPSPGTTVPTTAFLVNVMFRLFGVGAPAGYHALLIAGHLAASVLAGVLAHRLTRNGWAGAAAVAVFGLHFAHVETVAWFGSVAEVVAGVLGLAAVLAFSALPGGRPRALGRDRGCGVRLGARRQSHRGADHRGICAGGPLELRSRPWTPLGCTLDLRPARGTGGCVPCHRGRRPRRGRRKRGLRLQLRLACAAECALVPGCSYCAIYRAGVVQCPPCAAVRTGWDRVIRRCRGDGEIRAGNCRAPWLSLARLAGLQSVVRDGRAWLLPPHYAWKGLSRCSAEQCFTLPICLPHLF